ncbi:MAG: NAD(P)H-dependent glycerol-3-phosphate dehydrogenase [Thermodesulfobacteriota bacterium]
MTATSRRAEPEKLAVVGAGSWGTALAWHLARKGLEVDLWVYEPEVCEQIKSGRENKTFLPGVPLPENVHVSNDLEEVVPGHGVVLMVVPSHVMRPVTSRLAGFVLPGALLCSAAKGIENETFLTMTQVIEEELPQDLVWRRACLSGPTFAREVSQGLPTAVTVACPDREAARRMQNLLSSKMMRVYASNDLIGVELGGALKNIFALAAGIADGLGLGANARAALITRGLAEMSRLGVKMGANPLTFMGLAGLGDLVLTCTGDLSRNRTVGLKLGRGLKLPDILAEMKMVAEGIKTARSVYGLAKREGVAMPITEEVYRILYEDKPPLQGLADLMSRDLRDEIEHVLAL